MKGRKRSSAASLQNFETKLTENVVCMYVCAQVCMFLHARMWLCVHTYICSRAALSRCLSIHVFRPCHSLNPYSFKDQASSINCYLDLISTEPDPVFPHITPQLVQVTNALPMHSNICPACSDFMKHMNLFKAIYSEVLCLVGKCSLGRVMKTC